MRVTEARSRIRHRIDHLDGAIKELHRVAAVVQGHGLPVTSEGSLVSRVQGAGQRPGVVAARGCG